LCHLRIDEFGHLFEPIELIVALPGYTSNRSVEMRSDWGRKLGVARVWLLGAGVVVIALIYLLKR